METKSAATPGTGAQPRPIAKEPRGPIGMNTAGHPSGAAPPNSAAVAKQFDQEPHEAQSHWSETAVHGPSQSMEESTWLPRIRTDTNES